MDIAKEMLANKLAEVIKENIDSFELDMLYNLKKAENRINRKMKGMFL